MRVRGLQFALQAGLIPGDLIHLRLNRIIHEGVGWVGRDGSEGGWGGGKRVGGGGGGRRLRKRWKQLVEDCSI